MRTKTTQEVLAQRFAAEIAKGKTQTDAYRTVWPRTRKLDPQRVAEYAYRFAAKHQINARVMAIRSEMRLAEIYPVAQWLNDSITQRDAAFAAGNYNAAGNYQRQIGQAVGAIGADQTTVVVAEKLSDVELIKRLSEGNPDLAKALGKTIAAKPDTQDVVVKLAKTG